jgi:DNA repair protein RadC
MIITVNEKRNISTPKIVFEILQEILKSESEADQDKEHLWVFYMTSRHAIKALELVSLGTLNSSLVHPREVFTQAIAYRCAYILMAHNHPSNHHEPSADDISITERIATAGELLGIELVDHVIIGQDGFSSLKQLGHL